jgi:minor extracellular serine protease Vpr
LFSKNALKRVMRLVVLLGALALTASIALAQDSATAQRGDRNQTDRPLPASIDGLKLDTPATADADAVAARRLEPALRGATGRQRVIVRLTQPAAAQADGPSAQGLAQQAAQVQQGAVVGAARALDANARVLGTLKIVLNAVMLDIDAAALPALAANPNVASISLVRDYELDLSETVEYIGATSLQDMGYDGTGIVVAVIDSGIDYTHIAFGGSGDPADFEANDPAIIEPGSFPTAKVIGGYDFVGSNWPNTAEEPDPDPIDDGAGGGHGTHVADIIGGELGVAPGASLYALKVCSSVSNSCSGLAMMQAIEFAVDPNGDGNTDDHVDVLNMSIGSNYGDPRWDDTSLAVNNAAAIGVLSVVSAGNSGDKPYSTGTPSAASAALAVAQTQVPSALQDVMEVVAPEAIAGQYPAVWQPWSVPLSESGAVEGPLQYGDTDGDNLNGCAPFDGDMTGKIVLVDRGSCNFTLKISNISQAGALAGIIGLVAPGDPFTGADGGDRPIDIPGFMISQAHSNMLKSALASGEVIVRFDPEDGISLVGHVVGSSSRGPATGTNEAGPDIGAPGASISALAGTGTGTEVFGGTSGAAPMVTGSAALLMQAYPDRSWAEIRAVLMNTAETDIFVAPAQFGGDLAPISRIGGGEVRVDRAFASPLAAWNRGDLSGTLSFGFHEVTGQMDLIQRVTIRNYSDQAITLRSEVEHRFDNDATGVVRVTAPSWFTVPANGSTVVPVRLFIRPQLSRPLHQWVLNSGTQGANGNALTQVEYDGYIHFIGVGANAQDAMIHVPWHVLPRGAGRVETGFVPQTSSGWVRNTGLSEVYVDTYSLLGSSPEMAGDPTLGGNMAPADLRWVGVQTYPVPAGFCSDDPSFLMGLAANTWDRYSHANNILIQFELDTTGDGNVDYLVYNFDASLSGQLSDGRSLTWVEDLNAGTADAFFFTQHETNSGNFVLYFCGEQIGLNAEDFFTASMNVDAYAVDWYYNSGSADGITGMNVVPLGERYFTVFANGDAGFTTLPPRSPRLRFGILDFGDQLNETETGVLWLYGPGAPVEARTWIIQP